MRVSNCGSRIGGRCNLSFHHHLSTVAVPPTSPHPHPYSLIHILDLPFMGKKRRLRATEGSPRSSARCWQARFACGSHTTARHACKSCAAKTYLRTRSRSSSYYATPPRRNPPSVRSSQRKRGIGLAQWCVTAISSIQRADRLAPLTLLSPLLGLPMWDTGSNKLPGERDV